MDFYSPDVLADVISYISELSLDGIDTLQSRALNKDNALSDEELAMALFAEEAEGLLNVAKERVGQATGRRTTIFEELEEMEAAARYDHLVALAISEGREIPPPPASSSSSRTSLVEPDSDDESSGASSSSISDAGDELDARPAPISLHSYLTLMSTEQLPTGEAQADDEEEDDSESEDDAPDVVTFAKEPQSPVVEEYPLQQCTICGDDIQGLVYKAPCGDVFDTECLQTMFRKATVEESLFPPRCCLTDIPVAEARVHLSHDLVDLYNKKAIEFGTPSRVYCHEPRCSAFIKATTDEPVMLKCPECPASTCGFCKAKAHAGKKCSDTDDLNSMAEDMKEKDGWQRCPDCRHVVELTIGCYHIICVCKAQFCYMCGVRWKGCSCPQFAVPPDLE